MFFFRRKIDIEKLKKNKNTKSLQKILYKSKNVSLSKKAAVALSQIKNQDASSVLIKGLTNDNDRVKINIIEALGLTEDSYLEYLTPLLSDKDVGVQKAATFALGRIGDKKSIEPLIDSMKHGLRYPEDFGGMVQASEAIALSWMGTCAVLPLFKLTESNNYQVAYNAKIALEEMLCFFEFDASREEIEFLLNGLTSEKKSIRGFSAIALGAVGEKQSAAELTTAYEKEECLDVKLSILWALRKIRNPKSIELLEKATKDNSAEIRSLSVTSISQLKDEKYIELILSMVNDPEAIVRSSAILGLKNFMNDRIIKKTRNFVNDKDRNVRLNLIYAFRGTKSNLIVDPLIDLSKDKDAGIRESAAFYLGDIGNEKCVDALLSLLKDKEGSVRSIAIRILSRINVSLYFSHFSSLLTDPNSSVRFSAEKALSKIRDSRLIKKLINISINGDDKLQKAIAEILGDTQSQESIDYLFKLFETGDYSIKLSPAISLLKFGYNKPIAKLLFTGNQFSKEVVLMSIGSIYSLEDRSGALKKEDLLDTLFKFIKREESEELRQSAANTISKITDIKIDIIKVNKRAFNRKLKKLNIIESISSSQENQTVHTLIEMLDDSSTTVRRKALHALQRLKGEETLEAILKVFKEDENDFVRADAANALRKKYDDTKSLSIKNILSTGMKDFSPEVRKASRPISLYLNLNSKIVNRILNISS